MAWIAILLMALATYATRVAGFLFAQHPMRSQWSNRFLRHVPAAILVSMIAPHALNHGHEEATGFLVVAIVQVMKKNALLSMGCGVTVVIAMRYLHI
jgi:uncharacterized membrane protein